MTGDTIAAVATPLGPGGVGVIRISGPAAPRIAANLLGRAPRPRHAHLLTWADAEGEAIDSGLLLHFPAPASFTGEHVVELQGHGSAPLLARTLRRLYELGARAARPGEFSERAFLNGKLDLAQAEAIADLISAGSESAARAALRSLQGEFSRRVDSLLAALIALRVHVEAAIDFPEEEIDFLGDGQIRSTLDTVIEQHAMLLQEAERGQRLRDGLHVLILGPPNAGKSSLLNALSGSDRAIVTDQAGTTRDLLREDVLLDGVSLTLVDSAGLRDSHDAIEQEGIRRARAEIERADLLLLVVAAGDEAGAEALREQLPANPPPRIWLHNKIDLQPDIVLRQNTVGGTSPDETLQSAQQTAPPPTATEELHIPISARTGSGLDRLRAALSQAAGHSAETQGSFSARQRHVDALRQVGQALQRASTCLEHGDGELVAEELRQAQHALSAITGAFHSDDLLGEIFSSFCIGK